MSARCSGSEAVASGPDPADVAEARTAWQPAMVRGHIRDCAELLRSNRTLKGAENEYDFQTGK
jgi:hypothetical protein